MKLERAVRRAAVDSIMWAAACVASIVLLDLHYIYKTTVFASHFAIAGAALFIATLIARIASQRVVSDTLREAGASDFTRLVYELGLLLNYSIVPIGLAYAYSGDVTTLSYAYVPSIIALTLHAMLFATGGYAVHARTAPAAAAAADPPVTAIAAAAAAAAADED